LSCGRIDSQVFFQLDEIDGEPYLNTYDLVTVNEDGSMTCIGRMNKYFVNNEGIRFDAGLVENAVSAQPGIESCGLAPEYDKMIHDTFPVLYVQTTGRTGAYAIQTVRQALYNVFIRDNKISETNLPGQCVLTDRIPYTATGKVDVYSILKGETKGIRYKITPIRQQGRLVDIQLNPAHFDAIGMWAGLPEELQGDAEAVNRLIGLAPQGGTSPQQQNSTPGIYLGQLQNLLQQLLGWQIQESNQNAQYHPQFQNHNTYE
jgi:hypothetical protein